MTLKARRVPVVAVLPAAEVDFVNAAVRIDPLIWRRGIYYNETEADKRSRDLERVFVLLGQGDLDAVMEFPFVEAAYLGERIRRGVPNHLRQEVLSAGKCASCGAPDRLEVDHIYPVCRGGSNERSNLQALCRSCNASKGPQTMEEWGGLE